jgi:Holliday junction resolvase RusA-like endonuclease
MATISFFVAGLPKPAGSKRGFFIPKLKRVVIVDANPNSKDWKTDVKHAAQAAYSGPPLTVPLAVKFAFFMPRPKGHFRSGRNSVMLRDSAPPFPAGKPDVLKLARGVEDAMTSIIYADDSQIVSERLLKRYAEGTPGVQVEISEETP